VIIEWDEMKSRFFELIRERFDNAVPSGLMFDVVNLGRGGKGGLVVCCESFIGDGGGPPGVGLQEQIPIARPWRLPGHDSKNRMLS
jgi:hypothetical protein